MNKQIWIEPKQCPELWHIASRCGYDGKKLEVETFNGPKNVSSYWSEGSRDYWTIYNLANGEKESICENGSGFGMKAITLDSLEDNLALVRIHHGRVTYCTIFFRPDQITKLLPAPGPELSREEQIVIDFTCALKSFARYDEAKSYTGITRDAWDAAKLALVEKKLLNKSGAITPTGRNARKHSDPWRWSKE